MVGAVVACAVHRLSYCHRCIHKGGRLIGGRAWQRLDILYSERKDPHQAIWRMQRTTGRPLFAIYWYYTKPHEPSLLNLGFNFQVVNHVCNLHYWIYAVVIQVFLNTMTLNM